MENFFETNISKSVIDSNKGKNIELISREVSNGDKIEVGKNTLVYLEDNNSNYIKKDLKKIEELKNNFILPKEVKIKNAYLINKNDGSRFVELVMREDTPSYFVKFRTLNIGDAKETEQVFETISTSQCIFGYGNTKAKVEDGSSLIFRNGKFESPIDSGLITPQPIVAWDIEDTISLYELEALCRKMSFVNSLASSDTKFNKIILNTARVEYYLAGVDFYQKGLLSNELLLEWFKIIDKRTDRLNKLMSNRLKSSFSIVFNSPLEELRGYIIDKVKSSDAIVVGDALEILAKDRLWQNVINIKKPNSWGNLVDTAIMVEELRNSFETNKGSVIVKSPKQESTFFHSEEVAKKLYHVYGDSFNLIAMYPHERIIVSHDTPKKNILSYIPETMSLSTAKKVINQYDLNKKL